MARSHASFNGTSTVFPTIYDTSQGTTLGGTASPGQGAMFALLALNVPNTTIAVPSSTTSGTNTSSPASTIPAKKKTSIGAVIGGVVGGLCVIGVAVAAAVMWMHRPRKLTRTHKKAQDILAEPEPFIYNTVPQFPSVSVPSGPAQVVEASAFHSMHLPSKVQERIVYYPSTRHPTPVASAISGASRSPVTSSGELGYANPAGPGGSISTTDVQELRTQVENLQRVVQGIQLDNMEPPPVYMG
ncbi:hypothetical protein OBBRIDRAFT_511008 [Obba rivulosa]|uniref:Uncharacterized protein n=1 Tax=Obba rivulosa TaxID=1052685 RepID=A0A8E2AG30_9APHY|nr:hypothetical protein OBBRIDRAFT_511008 [Obba rivulosa]